MKDIRIYISILACIAVISCDSIKPKEQSQSRPTVELVTFLDSVNYAIGMNLTPQFDYFNEEDFRPEMMEKAVRELTELRSDGLTQDEQKEVLQPYFRWAREYKKDSILKRSEHFLSNNRKRPEVIETKRGLQYEIVNSGDPSGESPDGNDIAIAFYKQGTPEKGILWDAAKNSETTQDTSQLFLNQVYSGISEAIQYMKPGDEFKIWVHPEIGSQEGDDILKVTEYNEVVYAEIKLIKFYPRSTELIPSEEKNVRPGFFLDETRRDD